MAKSKAPFYPLVSETGAASVLPCGCRDCVPVRGETLFTGRHNRSGAVVTYKATDENRPTAPLPLEPKRRRGRASAAPRSSDPADLVRVSPTRPGETRQALDRVRAGRPSRPVVETIDTKAADVASSRANLNETNAREAAEIIAAIEWTDLTRATVLALAEKGRRYRPGLRKALRQAATNRARREINENARASLVEFARGVA